VLVILLPSNLEFDFLPSKQEVQLQTPKSRRASVSGLSSRRRQLDPQVYLNLDGQSSAEVEDEGTASEISFPQVESVLPSSLGTRTDANSPPSVITLTKSQASVTLIAVRRARCKKDCKRLRLMINKGNQELSNTCILDILQCPTAYVRQGPPFHTNSTDPLWNLSELACIPVYQMAPF